MAFVLPKSNHRNQYSSRAHITTGEATSLCHYKDPDTGLYCTHLNNKHHTGTMFCHLHREKREDEPPLCGVSACGQACCYREYMDELGVLKRLYHERCWQHSAHEFVIIGTMNAKVLKIAPF